MVYSTYEMLVIKSAARLGLSDDEFGDKIADRLDISDKDMLGMIDRLKNDTNLTGDVLQNLDDTYVLVVTEAATLTFADAELRDELADSLDTSCDKVRGVSDRLKADLASRASQKISNDLIDAIRSALAVHREIAQKIRAEMDAFNKEVSFVYGLSDVHENNPDHDLSEDQALDVLGYIKKNDKGIAGSVFKEVAEYLFSSSTARLR